MAFYGRSVRYSRWPILRARTAWNSYEHYRNSASKLKRRNTRWSRQIKRSMICVRDVLKEPRFSHLEGMVVATSRGRSPRSHTAIGELANLAARSVMQRLVGGSNGDRVTPSLQ